MDVQRHTRNVQCRTCSAPLIECALTEDLTPHAKLEQGVLSFGTPPGRGTLSVNWVEDGPSQIELVSAKLTVALYAVDLESAALDRCPGCGAALSAEAVKERP